MDGQLPADVQAALDAYLAARVDDATWTAYIDGLGPGIALDVATTLCIELCICSKPDSAAADLLRDLVAPGPEILADWDGETPGITAYSQSVAAHIWSDGLAFLHLGVERGSGNRWPPARYTAFIGGDTWDCEGSVTEDERRKWLHEEWRAHPDSTGGVDPWAIALCRAHCHGWSPEWVQEQREATDAPPPPAPYVFPTVTPSAIYACPACALESQVPLVAPGEYSMCCRGCGFPRTVQVAPVSQEPT